MKTTIEIRFSDEDSQQHVHHEAMVGYIAYARVKYIDGLLEEFGLKETIDYVLVSMNMDFVTAIRYPGVVEIEAFPFAVGTRSFTTTYELNRAGVHFCDAECVSVFFDIDSGATVDVPQQIRDLIG